MRRRERRPRRFEEEKKEWIPKTELGKQVMKGEIKTIDDILSKGLVILEPEIVDYLVPDMQDDIIYVGGSPGKGGGIRRTATKRTARMHKSGRRYKLMALVVVGNGDGIIGLGSATSGEHRTALEKAMLKAKLNIIRVKRGCGSWECGCGGKHSIPFRTEAKRGSVRVVMMPAPKGTGIVAGGEIKKMLKLGGLRDVYVKTFGQTGTRYNLANAVFAALEKLNSIKGDE